MATEIEIKLGKFVHNGLDYTFKENLSSYFWTEFLNFFNSKIGTEYRYEKEYKYIPYEDILIIKSEIQAKIATILSY